MKIRPTLPLVLLAISMSCLAQEANPFVQKKAEAKTPEPPPGPSFVGILEHIFVPPDMIDGWIRQHGMPADATRLRAEVQTWVEQGKATLNCTTMATGVMGRKSYNEWILEQTYPTDYSPGGAGAWPYPTGFETRNLGHEANFLAREMDGKVRFSVAVEFGEMQGSRPWNPLMEKTRQPTDVFMPVIRTFRVNNHSGDRHTADVDPFAEPVSGDPGALDHCPDIDAEGIHLLARFDPLPTERKQGRLSRLVFARGAVSTQNEEQPLLAEDFTVSVAAFRVPHLEFSTWLQQHAPLAAQMDAWQFVENLRKEGKAEVVESANSRAKVSKANTIENISEIIYPTEWEPATHRTVLERWEERLPQKVNGKQVDGVATRATVKIESIPGLAGASLATAFDTRNTGMTYEIRMIPNDVGILAQHTFERVIHLGDSVSRRIEDQGNWVPDITMPIFTTSRFSTTSRLISSTWMLIATGPEFSETGEPDRDHCVLMFVKVE